ncbi:hypothetical protein BJ085DRAFT_40102 [Dimargaris cristalligena]|uniref:Uncharacterized protein n=1 Tax=Dimargaris cristalligena TaxID=215637 RepID=A0A4P9ZLQ5_9FUNG|nr:hypothetical protein BJ085DRAFT_40102 [Dimargaris cristalligena]|eukprot:RKP33532.1 hypothetical protein BJ085DRAFT_40102 [Dimargaris cristalligena]
MKLSFALTTLLIVIATTGQLVVAAPAPWLELTEPAPKSTFQKAKELWGSHKSLLD